MKTLIVYDSVFGNTEKIASAIAEAVGTEEKVMVVKAAEVKPEQLTDVNLLIVGSPTRAFRPTKPVSDFLVNLPANSLKGVDIAAFDTRVNTIDINSKVLNGFVKVFGYAAKPIADKLQKKGGNLIIQPEGFYVKESEGPLKDGELERAAGWLADIIQRR